MTPFIECLKLTKTYRKGPEILTPLKELDLTVAKGEFLSLMGPSGSGKTTLLNLIAGIDTPDSGKLLIDGTDLTVLSGRALARWRATTCGYIFQLYHLVPILSAFENVELPLLLSKLSRSERHRRVNKALERVALTDRATHRPPELSGGQEQRVALARAIVTDPPLLVADEPTGDLDGESAANILSLLQGLAHDNGKTIVMVTHDPRASAAADRCLHLEKGQLLENAQPAFAR